MNKIVLFTTFLLFTLIGKGFLCAQNMMHYTSDEFKYSIQIPEDWKRTDDVSEKVALVMISNEGASVSITFYKLIEGPLEHFIDQYEQSLSGNLEGLEILEKGNFKSRDDEATYLIYTFKKEGKVMREKICFYHREGEIAIVTVNNSDEKFYENLPVFNKILRSFTFETSQEKVDILEPVE